MIDHFAEATKDYQWIHVDQQRAEKNQPTSQQLLMALCRSL